MEIPDFQLNPQQQYFHDAVIHSLRHEARMFFLEGHAGTGKTFLLNAIGREALRSNFSVAAVASSGVAAVEIGGVTAHSLFVLGIEGVHDEDGNEMEQEAGAMTENRASFLRTIHLLLWDEVSMSTHHTIRNVDQILKDLTGVQDIPFGGKVVVFSGDKRAFLPPTDPVTTAFNWQLWPRVLKYTLTEDVRITDPSFSRQVQEIGDNRFVDEGRVNHYAEIDEEMFVNSYEELFDHTFSECLDEDSPKEAFGRMILTLDNAESLQRSNDILEELLPDEEVHEILGSTEPVDNPEGVAEQQLQIYINATPYGWPPHTLRLKIGANIILLVNVDTGITGTRRNGTILTVDEILDEELICTIRNGHHAGHLATIPKYVFQGESYSFKRTQFPVRLAYSMTVYKAQGQNLKKVGFYLNGTAFNFGQIYTAVSRVRTKDDIKIYMTGKRRTISSSCQSRVVVHNMFNFASFLAASAGNQLRRDLLPGF